MKINPRENKGKKALGNYLNLTSEGNTKKIPQHQKAKKEVIESIFGK